MKIFITIPDFSIHGGIRIIVEWANRLSEKHSVYLHCLNPKSTPEYYRLNPKVRLCGPDMSGADCLIITSPHSIHFQHNKSAPKKIFLFMQMVEHMFHENSTSWYERCREFYTSPHPMFAISQWNIDMVKNKFGRKGITHYIGNGVNLQDFPVLDLPKSHPIVLVEGWEGYNSAKDIDSIGPKAAARLKNDGYTIVSFGHLPIKTMARVPSKYYLKPSLKKLNELYQSAAILIKASRYDARSCSPMEAMTKGTVTARAIIEGDDDLIHLDNCLKVPYNEDQLYRAAKYLLTHHQHRQTLALNGYRHLEKYSWEYWMNHINKILCA